MFFFSLTLAVLDQGAVIQSPDFILFPLEKNNVLRTKNFKGGWGGLVEERINMFAS